MKKRINRGQQQRKKLRHVSLYESRNQWNDLERIFSEHWAKENVPLPGLKDGHGTLQCLLRVPVKGCVNSGEFGWKREMRHAFKIHQRDATIAATLVQWLGSNCGYNFLDRVFREAGYNLTETEERRKSRVYSDPAEIIKTEKPPLPGGAQLVKMLNAIDYSGEVAGYRITRSRGSRSAWAGEEAVEWDHFYFTGGVSGEKLSAVQVAKRIIAHEKGKKERVNLP